MLKRDCCWSFQLTNESVYFTLLANHSQVQYSILLDKKFFHTLVTLHNTIYAMFHYNSSLLSLLINDNAFPSPPRKENTESKKLLLLLSKTFWNYFKCMTYKWFHTIDEFNLAKNYYGTSFSIMKITWKWMMRSERVFMFWNLQS